jgi:outer membrane protein TolC
MKNHPTPRRFARRAGLVPCSLLALALPIGASGSLPADDREAQGDPLVIDLDHAVAAALESNPRLRAARLRYEALLERPARIGALPDPMLSYSGMFEDIETANGPIVRTVELSQEFPFRRKRPLLAEASRLEADAAAQAWQAARLEVTHAVRSAYYDLFRIGRAIAIVKEEGELLDRLEQAARGRYAAGLIGLQDVLRVQTERTTIEERLLGLRQEREEAAARFSEASGRPQSDDVGEALEPPDRTDDLPDEERLYRLARDLRPEVAEARLTVDASLAMEEVARRDRRPDFRVALQWSQIGGSVNPFAPAPGQDAVMATVGISLPIRGDGPAAGLREAQATTSAARGEVEARANRVESEVRAALASLRARRDLVALYETTLLPQAEAALQAAEAAYRTGGTDLLSVLDGERRLLAARLAHAVGLGEIGRSVAALERAVGIDLDALRSGATGEAAGESPR